MRRAALWLLLVVVGARYLWRKLVHRRIPESKTIDVAVRDGAVVLTVQEWPAMAALEFLAFARGIIEAVLDEARRESRADALDDPRAVRRGLANMRWQLPVLDDDGNAVTETVAGVDGKPDRKVPVKELNFDLILRLTASVAGYVSSEENLVVRMVDAAVVCDEPHKSGVEMLKSLRAGDFVKVAAAVVKLNFSRESSLGKSIGELLPRAETPAKPSSASPPPATREQTSSMPPPTPPASASRPASAPSSSASAAPV